MIARVFPSMSATVIAAPSPTMRLSEPAPVAKFIVSVCSASTSIRANPAPPTVAAPDAELAWKRPLSVTLTPSVACTLLVSLT